MTVSFTDWAAICETKARYCRCVDTKDWAGLADCFTEDFVLEMPGVGGTHHGRDAAMALIRTSVEIATTAHHVHNPEIAFDGDGAADVIWAMQDRVLWKEDRRAAMGNAGHNGFGNYHERYVKCTDGKWRIAREKLSYLHMDIYPLD